MQRLDLIWWSLWRWMWLAWPSFFLPPSFLFSFSSFFFFLGDFSDSSLVCVCVFLSWESKGERKNFQILFFWFFWFELLFNVFHKSCQLANFPTCPLACKTMCKPMVLFSLDCGVWEGGKGRELWLPWEAWLSFSRKLSPNLTIILFQPS